MQIIRKKILLNSNLVTKIPLNSDFTQYGDDQANEELIKLKANESINPIIDNELIRYKYENILNEKHNLIFSFNQKDIYTYPPLFSNLFTESEINGNSKNYQNSFFILEIFDTNDIYTQNKLSSTYITKKPSSGLALFQLNNYSDISLVNQGNSIYIPEYFINSTTGNTINCFCRMLFYNAKSGQTINFFNNININSSDSSKLFFEIQINKINKNWKFINQKYIDGNEPFIAIVAIEPNKNNQYAKKISDGVENIKNNIENYPVGSVFDYKIIDYI